MQNILNIDKLKFDDNGLIPAIIIDYYTKEVLTLAYMNKESLEISLKEGKTCFYSRSRKKLRKILPRFFLISYQFRY